MEFVMNEVAVGRMFLECL